MVQDIKSIHAGDESILVVDDEEPLARMIGKTLQRLGYRVTVVTDSQKALELFAGAPQQFDLVVSDQTMPRLTGCELADSLVKIRGDIPVIVCSGSEEIPAHVSRAVSKTIRKPFMGDELEAAVRSVLDGASS